MIKALIASGAGAEATRIELTRDHGLDRAKLTQFRIVAGELMRTRESPASSPAGLWAARRFLGEVDGGR